MVRYQMPLKSAASQGAAARTPRNGGDMLEPESPKAARSRAAERLATVALLALLLYLLLVVVMDATPALSLRNVVLVFMAAAIVLRHGIRKAREPGALSPGTLLNLGLLSGALTVSFLVLDLGVSAYLGLTAPSTDQEDLAQRDGNGWVGEWYPRLYYPSDRNFRLHKPGFTITGDHYGVFYLPAMLASPTLVDSVLDRRHVSIRINELGFRESSPIEACRVFTLGDSFTFGWGVTEGAAWPDLLERHLGECVYNLGIHDASPMQELLLLESLVGGPRRFAPSRVIWVIYEGNDLEDSYDDRSPGPSRAGRVARATKGTVIETLRASVYRVRTQSLGHRLRTGEVRLTSPGRRSREAGHYAVDGVGLVNPLFRSSRFGPMLLHAPYLERAAQSEDYLLQHANRPKLDRILQRMRQLGDSLHFHVTVAIMPTSLRLYAPTLDLTPGPSAVPYFVNYVKRAARAQGFDVIDLLQALQPYAGTELLNFRDDDHLNQRGNEVLAGILADHLAEVEAGRSAAPPRP
jgi:lysophospholipase L1-like esterase